MPSNIFPSGSGTIGSTIIPAIVASSQHFFGIGYESRILSLPMGTNTIGSKLEGRVTQLLRNISGWTLWQAASENMLHPIRVRGLYPNSQGTVYLLVSEIRLSTNVAINGSVVWMIHHILHGVAHPNGLRDIFGVTILRQVETNHLPGILAS